MAGARRKLNNQRGESMIFAMLLLLVAVVVSVAVITAASSAAHQVNDSRELQQAYLTVSSAAELLREELAEKTYTRTVTSYQYKAGAEIAKEDDVAETLPDSNLKDFLKQNSQRICNAASGEVPALTRDKAKITTSEMDTVAADMSLTALSEDSFRLCIRLCIDNAADDGEGYRMEVQIPITRNVQVTSGGEYTLQWESGDETTYDVYQSLTRVSWGKCDISKGWTEDEEA